MKNSDFRYQKVLPYMNPNATNVKNVKRSLKPLPNFLARGQNQRILKIPLMEAKMTRLEKEILSHVIWLA